MNLELGNMSKWVKGENTAVVRFCFFFVEIYHKKLKYLIGRGRKTKQNELLSSKMYLTSQKSKWLNWDMFEQADAARKPNEE